ncbi:MAG: XRE family transcriptional regulator [Bacteroidetes bacterium]|nr:MAG: XRE family transcriptional regulator [Bacteroidota bacterium]
METFGEQIRKLRTERKLPLRVVAAKLDIDQAILSKIETGKRQASRKHALKLAEYFRVDSKDLLVIWLSEKLVYELQDEDIALEALQIAEEKVAYGKGTASDKRSIISIITDFLKKDGRVSRAYLFGSIAREEAGTTSDVDLMVTYSDKASGTLLDYADLKFNLEKLLNRKVDLVEEGYIQSFALPSINRDKILIYG